MRDKSVRGREMKGMWKREDESRKGEERDRERREERD